MKNSAVKDKVIPQFILLKEERIRISTIKKYRPTTSNIKGGKYCIQLYFSINKMNERISFYYSTKIGRDADLEMLDKMTGVVERLTLKTK